MIEERTSFHKGTDKESSSPSTASQGEKTPFSCSKYISQSSSKQNQVTSKKKLRINMHHCRQLLNAEHNIAERLLSKYATK